MSEDKKIDGQVVVEHNASGMIVKEVIWKGVPYKNEPPFFKHEGNKYGTPEPTIKVSELREWCEARIKENNENIEFHFGSNDYEDIEDSVWSSGQNDLLKQILIFFCGGKDE